MFHNQGKLLSVSIAECNADLVILAVYFQLKSFEEPLGDRPFACRDQTLYR
jgi:hypothetical protein